MNGFGRLNGSGRSKALPFAFALGLVASGMPGAVNAQGDGFLLKRPTFSIGFWAGYAFPSADSEIFDLTREELTVDGNDFQSAAFGVDIAYRITERFDISLGTGVAHSSTDSEFRDFVGSDDLPILQTTRLTRVPTVVTVKAYLRDRGRAVSSFVWIPEKWSPYLGVGGGILWYRFEQEGEFVDFDTLEIFEDVFTSEGTTPTGHVFGGVDISLTPKLVLTGEGRYSFASSELGLDFSGFDNIDLTGFQARVGISVRF